MLDHGLHWLYKFATNDAWYYLNVEDLFGILVAFLMRTACKLAVDYAGLLQFRHPGALGGAYWTFSMFAAIVGSFCIIEFSYAKVGAEFIGLEKSTAWMIMGAFSGAWLVVFCVLLCLMKRDYIRTFFSLQTGNQLVQSWFLEGDSDEKKIKILDVNPHLWKSIRPQVRAFLLENWERWEEEKPAWFDDKIMAMVDDDMMPPEALARLRHKGGGKRRRSSLGERLGGASGEVAAPAANDEAAAEEV
jgi:hypothetical protein